MNRGLAIHIWYRAGTLVANGFVLNLLWVTCSLPLVTLLPSTLALFGTIHRLAQGEEGVVGPFLQEWRRGFRRSYTLGLPVLAVAAVLYGEIGYYGHRHDGMSLLMLGIIAGFTLAFASIAGHLFPVEAAYGMRTRDAFRTALYLGIRRFVPFAFRVFPVWIATGALLTAVPALLLAGIVPAAAWITYAVAARGMQAHLSAPGGGSRN